ncbi:MAG: hypothetical protein ACRC1H_01570, partial [Caldilineaceae bacterium]
GRGHACGDCVISVFLGTPAMPGTQGDGSTLLVPTRPVDLDADEAVALDALAQAGLVPPLRHMRPA